MAGLVGALLAAVLAAYWASSRQRARELAADVHRHAVRLDACAPDRDALLLALPEDRPAAPCAAIAGELADATRRLLSARFIREREVASDLASVAEPLAKVAWNARARALLEPPLSVALTDVRKAHSLALVLAASEGVEIAPSASPASAAPVAPREPRAALDVELPGPALELVWTASSVLAPGGRPLAVVTLAARTDRAPAVWLGRSLDRGKSWQSTRLEPLAPSKQLPRPHVAILAGGELAIAVIADGALQRFRWPASSARAQAVGETRPLPADTKPVTTGSALLSLSAFALTRSDGSGAVWYEPFDDESLRPAPPGRLVAATAAPPPRLVLARSSKTGFVELAQVAVPELEEPWPQATSSRVSYVPSLETLPSDDRWCGLAGEQHFTWLARAEKNHVLVAASQSGIYPYRFTLRPESDLDVLCGACPPAALERSRGGLGVYVPVIRKLAPAPIPPPLAFDATSAKTATAACAADRMAASYVAAERVLAQITRPNSWQFQRPIELATPDSTGSPVEPRVLGFDDRLLVLWRRSAIGTPRVRIESVELPSP